ncbi:MAG: TIGR04053 family radical SAM/SPASM domain-containing protein [Actinomycetota bacterium]
MSSHAQHPESQGGAGLAPGARAMRAERDGRLASWDVNTAPFTVAWELTRACAYVCLHCRADAQPYRDPNELTTEEIFAVVDDLARFGSSILVLTGGDPMARPDLEDIAARAHSLGLRVALSPSATARVTRKRLVSLREAGVRRVALSLDGVDAAVHDGFRGLPGSFARTKSITQTLAEEDLALQINTTVARHNVESLPEMARVVAGMEPVQWSLFFLVPTGRAQIATMLSAAEHERLFNWIYDLSHVAPFDIKVTEAPAYRRVVAARNGQGANAPVAGAGYRFADGLDRPAVGIGDGKGFMFISHTGDVTPSGFLPFTAGNVRERSAVEIYRDSPIFRALRDPAALKGGCGSCEFNSLCGGSRSRAYAVTGDYLAADPACVLA